MTVPLVSAPVFAPVSAPGSAAAAPRDAAPPLVSVVTINWNNRDFIEQCIEHVLAQSHPRLELIVVDNASSDGSYELLCARYAGRITLIRAETNTGFTGGMNRGIAASSGDYVLILNSDVFLAPGFVARAVEAFARPEHVRVGVVGGKLLQLVDGAKTAAVDTVGSYLKLRMAVRSSRNHGQPELVFGPASAAPLLRRALLDDVQLGPGEWFDAHYFAYNEDIDLWFRTHLAGWQVLFLPTAVGWHMHSGSVAGQKRLYARSPLLQYHALKNRYMTILKDYPALLLWLFGPFLLALELPVALFFAVRSPGSLRSLWQAQRYILRNWRRIMQRRRSIQQRRRIPALRLLRFFKSI
jgi:GT2 family glycosyltransferase